MSSPPNMPNQVVVYKNRVTVLKVSLGYDVSADSFVSEIRTDDSPDSDLIATWAVDFASDGIDGKLICTLTELQTRDVVHTNGFMDIKRVSDGKALAVVDKPIQVVFQNTVTA